MEECQVTLDDYCSCGNLLSACNGHMPSCVDCGKEVCCCLQCHTMHCDSEQLCSVRTKLYENLKMDYKQRDRR